MVVSRIEDLLQIERIKQLKARYFRFLDTKQWEAWGGVFTADATVVVQAAATTWGGDPGLSSSFEGREAIVAGVRAMIHDCVTVHHGHMPEITVTSPATATGVWAMEDLVETGAQDMQGHGHYHETYRLEDGEWRIATLLLTRLRLRSVTQTRR